MLNRHSLKLVDARAESHLPQKDASYSSYLLESSPYWQDQGEHGWFLHYFEPTKKKLGAFVRVIKGIPYCILGNKLIQNQPSMRRSQPLEEGFLLLQPLVRPNSPILFLNRTLSMPFFIWLSQRFKVPWSFQSTISKREWIMMQEILKGCQFFKVK